MEDINIKALEVIEKAGKGAAIGEIRVWGGKRYHKTPKGWRPVPKGYKGEVKKEESKTESREDEVKSAYTFKKYALKNGGINEELIRKYKDVLRKNPDEAREVLREFSGKPLDAEFIKDFYDILEMDRVQAFSVITPDIVDVIGSRLKPAIIRTNMNMTGKQKTAAINAIKDVKGGSQKQELDTAEFRQKGNGRWEIDTPVGGALIQERDGKFDVRVWDENDRYFFHDKKSFDSRNEAEIFAKIVLKRESQRRGSSAASGETEEKRESTLIRKKDQVIMEAILNKIFGYDLEGYDFQGRSLNIRVSGKAYGDGYDIRREYELKNGEPTQKVQNWGKSRLGTVMKELGKANLKKLDKISLSETYD